MVKSYKKDYFTDRKLKWEKNHGKFIHEFMFNEYQARILGQCNTALNDLQRQLDLEIARAKAEELRIENKAHNELEKVYNATKFMDGISLNEVLNSTEDLSKLFGYLYSDDNGHIVLTDARENLFNAYNNTLRTLMSANNDNVDIFNQRIDTLSQNSLDNFNKLLRITNVITSDNINDAPNEKTVYPYASWKQTNNELETTTPSTAQKTLPDTLSDSYNAIAQSVHKINENINKVLRYSNLYSSNKYDINAINDTEINKYPTINVRDDGGYKVDISQSSLNNVLNNSFAVIVTALNNLRTSVKALERK